MFLQQPQGGHGVEQDANRSPIAMNHFRDHSQRESLLANGGEEVQFGGSAITQAGRKPAIISRIWSRLGTELVTAKVSLYLRLCNFKVAGTRGVP